MLNRHLIICNKMIIFRTKLVQFYWEIIQRTYGRIRNAYPGSHKCRMLISINGMYR